MEKDFLTPDLTESMDEAIADAQKLTPEDDPKLDPILPSQMTLKEDRPNKRTMSMDDALKTYRLRLDSVETQNKIASGDITTHFWGNAAKGFGDFIAEVKTAPAKFDGAIYRAFNGHIWPDMTEDEAVRLVDAATSYVANQEGLRSIIQQSEGAADSVARPFFSGAGQVLSYGIVGLLTGGVGIGAIAGIQEATELSQELAETAMEENEGTLRGYDNRGDAIYSALHGVISGWIETRLGVENLFTNSVKKQGIRKLGEQVLKSAVGEGAEEYLQEASKYLFANMAGKNKRTFGEFQKDALTNAVYGALLGGTFGGLMYYPNKLRIQKALKAQGYTDVQAAAIAEDMIGTTKNSILKEVDTRAQLREHYGDQWTNLQNKIVTALENAGWKESHPEIDLQKYAADNADDIVRPLFRFSNKYGIDTSDLLQLADINVIDNAIYLKPMNLGTPEVIADRIREKKQQVKRQTELAKTGAGNAEKKQALNIQIELLQKIYEQQTGNRLAATRRTRAAKAQQDAEILANTAPAVSEIISGIDVSQMTTGQPTAQIRQEMDGQPFIYVGDKQLPVEYKVVPMDQVIASHIGQEINVNYSLKELQNRAQRGSRTDVSILQSRAAKIQPENLGISYNTQNGAPVINEKGEVIAGNGRYEVLRMTDEKGRARYNKYLESLGLDLTGIKDPILVRVLHGLTPEQQIAVADASNVSATSAFDNASQAVQDAKLLKGTNNVTDFLNKIPIESRQGLFLANDRVNKVALDRRYNDALMAWLLNNDTALYEELYLMGGITPKIQTALNQVTPQLMALENQYPDVGLRQDLANALKRLPSVARAQDFAFTISQVEIDDASTNLFNENALLYAMVFGKNTKTWEGTGVDRLQVGLTLPEFFDAYTQAAVQNQENMGKTDLFGQPLAVERTSGDILAETLTKAFPREFEENVAKSRDMKAVFLTRAQTKPGPTQLSQIDLMDTVQPSLFGDTSTATAVNNLPWERPVNVTNPIFFNRMPDATDIEVAKKNGYDSFLLMDKKEAPTSLVLLDGSVVNLKPGAKIPSASELYKPTQLFQTDMERNLVATHAISKNGMKEALRLGGFAMPSLAIQKKIDNSYGDIIFVAPANMAQPSRTTKVYDRDAWTPMINFIEYERKPGFYEKVEDILESHGMDKRRASTYISNIETGAEQPYPTWNPMAEELFGVVKGYDISEVDMRHEISNSIDLQREYEDWYYDFIKPNLQARIFRGFTNLGNRRYADVTLDNLVRELKTQPEHRDMSSDMYFFHDVMRELVTRFKTTKDIKKAQDRLVDANELAAKDTELHSEYNALATELRTDESNHIPEIALAEALIEGTGPMAQRLEEVGLKHDAESVKKVNDLVEKIKTIPVKYFEAKVRNAVKFDEFSGVFVPNKEDYNDIASELSEQGANVIRYGSSADLHEKFENLTQEDSGILFQSGYASMRGDLIGGALDADAFEGKGEGTSVWAWGNYLLKSKELDKAHYFDSFNRQGAPRILYDGHKISDMFMTDYAQTEVIRGLIDEKSKEEILADLEKTLNARKNEVERKTDYVYGRLENKISRQKLSEIIQDVYKLIDMGGVFYTKYPEGSIAADIQKKYKPQGENPEGKRFTEEFLSVVDAVALSYGGLDNANILRDSIKDLTVDIDIFKGMDFKKLSGLTGFTYKGRPIVKPIREQIAKHLDPTGRSYLVSEVEKQASDVLRDAVIKNKDVGEALAKAADEAEKNLMADAEKYKKRLLDTNDFTKEQKKVLDDIFAEITLGGSMALDDKSRLKIHKIADGKYTFNDQGKESWKINADLYNKFGFAFKSFESGAQKAKALREVANFFKNAKQKDFVLKSRASMYRFDVPSDRYLLDFTKTIENQSKYVINALNKLYNETHMGDRPSLRIVKSKNLEALPRYRRPQDITDNPNYDHIYNTVLDYDKELDAFILDWNDKGLKYAKNKLDSEIDRDERTIQVFKDTLKEKQEDLAKEEKYSDEYLRIEKAITSAENNISNLEERLEPKKAVKRNADKIPDNAKFSDYAEVEYEPDYHMKGYEYYQSIENSFRIGQEEEKKLAKSLGAIDKHGNIHAQKAASKLLEKYGLKGVKYYGNRDKTGFVTFGRTEPIERLLQGRAVNGFYDPELEVIVLGRNSNTGTLPHEMAHFWANTIFNLVKSGKYNNNTEFMAQAMGMFNMLGVGLNQDALTRDQQEQFATMTESVIFGMAPIPQGTELPMTAFLNWVPSKYKSILDIGYRDSTGRIVNPILDKQAVDWFNAWYANGTLPAIEMSPLAAQNTNDEQENRIIPSSSEVMKVRATEMKAEADDLKRAREEQVREITEATAISERAAAAGASVLIESQPGNIELSTPPEEKKRTITSFLIPGRGTNTREGMFAAARDYIAANREHAEEVAFGHPNEVMNDTGVDRAILIRALMEEYDRSDPKYAELYHNLAETVSLAGKTPGLSNDMNFQFYLSAVKQITDGMEAIAAIKYAGTRNLDKARRTFNSDIDAFIQENADKIMAANAENKDILVKKMFAEAAVKFKGDESALLAQEELRRVRSLKTKEAFIDLAGREIRKMLKATPDASMINKIMEESEKAQKAVKYLDSEDYAEMEAAGKTIRGWQLAVKEEQVPETWYSKLIGSWYPKAMLYNINTHTVNIGGNLINYGITKAAVAAQYKEGNKVPERVLKQERDRLRALYNSSLISVAGMRNPTSPTLLHGEQYNPREGKSTIGKIADFSMDLLGKEDNWFRTMAYVDALGYIATADAKKTGQSPTDLFREYKKLNQIKGTRAYEARQEALNIADIAVFQQNGTLARNLKKVRDALNMGQHAGLGTLLGPFVKTPANIVEMGARAIAAPVTSTYHAVKGDWSIQDTISTGYFVLACILLAGMMADYEPPYEVPHRYDPNKPYDSIRIRGTDMWIKLDTFAAASIPMRIIASIVTGKGLGVSGSMNEVPLLGDIADTWQQTAGIERDPYKQGVRFAANVAYNRVNTAVPAILKYTLAAMHPADLDLEQIETGLPKTGIGRKIGRQYGLDGGETTTNDILRIFFNRLKIAAE